MSRYMDGVLKNLKTHRVVSIIVSSILIAIFLVITLSVRSSAPSKLQVSITPYSNVTKDTGRTVFSINSQADYLYKSKDKKGLDAALEFLQLNPIIDSSPALFPSNFAKNATVTRQINDSTDTYLKKNGVAINNQHFFFNQKINGIPVYNSTVTVHIKNGDEVYATSGNVSTSTTQTPQKIDDQRAIQIALGQAKDESKSDQLTVEKSEKFYINDQLLGISDNPTNQIALEVFVKSKGEPVLFRTQYFVGLNNGKILYSESQTRDMLSRNIYNCQGGSCNKVRSEGAPATGDTDVDNAYDYFATVYNYYKNTFDRDSYDNAGASYNGYVHVPARLVLAGIPNQCPNAMWNGEEMVFCTGLVALDVTGHELTHALTGETAGLQYSNESGALNEAVSDIFGSAMDNNWDIGEDITPGIGIPVPLRSMSDPPSRNQPDKLSTYVCGSFDHGGVHANSGIINKAFYLMTDGGSFNGCTMSGIGRVKSHPIVYQALTRYLTQTSNFKDAYTTFMQACADLYGATSTECDNVNRALESTQIDQQPQSSPVSPVCTSQQLQPATCATSGSPSPNPTSPNSTITPSPTSAQGQTTNSIIGLVYTDTNNNSKYDTGELGYQGAVIAVSGALSASRATDASGNFAFNNVPSGNYVIVAKVAGQIVGQGPFIIPANVPVTEKIFIALNPTQANPTPVIIEPTVITPEPSPSTTPDNGGDGKFEPYASPTPTPDQLFTCVPDPACVASGKSMQMCPLKCSPQ